MYLELKNIHKSFGSGDNLTEVLRGISCGVEKGDICVLLGPSGSGKSTLLNIIGGIETADEGSIIIAGGVPAEAHRLCVPVLQSDSESDGKRKY